VKSIISQLLILMSAVLIIQNVSADEIRLIVRGDDLGMSQGSIAGFEKAFEQGVLTSASVQVPAPWFEAAAELAAQHPEWCFGVHLTLIGEWRGYRWRPVLPWGLLKSMVDEDGFLFRYPEELAQHHPRIEEIEAELNAQAALAIKKGIRVDYFDIHYVSPSLIPGLDAVLDRLAARYRVPVSGRLGEKRAAGIYQVAQAQKASAAVEMLNNLEPGLWLWVVHIGVKSPEQDALVHTKPEDVFPDGVGKHRAAELSAITSKEVKAVIAKRGLKLVSYRDLR
jgi:chitin disaccharide deacetylase